MRQPRPWRATGVVLFQLGGVLVMPWGVGLVAALYLEVSQVVETAPMLLLIAVVFIIPTFLLQVLGTSRG